MVYRAPSRRKAKKEFVKPNLIPILDAVFIFIFFLLMSANFVKIYEIPSDVPIISDAEPPPNQKPLALTLKISASYIEIQTGVPARTYTRIGKAADGFYDLEKLHSTLIDLKNRNLKEETAIFEPIVDLTYEEIVKIMDATRELRNTDPALFAKDKDGVEMRLKALFPKIIFGNIQS
tara:strand:+ start:12315 stop:12845 length:531 start_codon:yes stop_codon:yes gene_type:complete